MESSEVLGTYVPFVRGSSQVVGVFGCPVEHSLSPAMHNAAFAALKLSYIYVPFPVQPQALAAAVRSLPALGIVGVNLTIPHKEAVLSSLDEVAPYARRVGAVNTVHCVDTRLHGHNTDGAGFLAPLRSFDVPPRSLAVVVGAGGAARSVVFALAESGFRVALLNRSASRAVDLAAAVDACYPGSVRVIETDARAELGQAVAEASLLVQTTSVGMHPAEEALPDVPLEALHPALLVYDLIYNPVETRLLREARARGCRTLNGVQMLVHQGAAAFEIWTGVWPPTDVMEHAVLRQLGRDQ